MSTANIPAPTFGAPSSAQAIRVAVVAFALAVLIAASFLVGRVTDGSTSRAPAVRQTTVAHPGPVTCRIPGMPC